MNAMLMMGVIYRGTEGIMHVERATLLHAHETHTGTLTLIDRINACLWGMTGDVIRLHCAITSDEEVCNRLKTKEPPYDVSCTGFVNIDHRVVARRFEQLHPASFDHVNFEEYKMDLVLHVSNGTVVVAKKAFLALQLSSTVEFEGLKELSLMALLCTVEAKKLDLPLQMKLNALLQPYVEWHHPCPTPILQASRARTAPELLISRTALPVLALPQCETPNRWRKVSQVSLSDQQIYHLYLGMISPGFNLMVHCRWRISPACISIDEPSLNSLIEDGKRLLIHSWMWNHLPVAFRLNMLLEREIVTPLERVGQKTFEILGYQWRSRLAIVPIDFNPAREELLPLFDGGKEILAYS